MGTPEFAVATLRALVENGCNVIAVVTQPDRPVGRHGSVTQPSPVKTFALQHGIPVLQPEKMKDVTFVDSLRSYDADLQVVVAFRMLPESVWSMPRFGTFNVHASLLPQYRGAAPINWAVINGETTTGITTFFIDTDIDTGRVIMQVPYVIGDDCNAGDVHDGLMKAGADACLKTLDIIAAADGHPQSIPQDKLPAGGTTLHAAPKIFKDTCRINWHQPAKKIYDFIRGLSPTPGAWTTLVSDIPDGKATTMKLFAATKTDIKTAEAPGTIVVERRELFIAAEDNLLRIDSLQCAGKRQMSANDFLNGAARLSICRME